VIPASPLGKVKMIGEVAAILALILGRDFPLLLMIGHAALAAAVVAALISCAAYFRRFNLLLTPRVADFSAAREQRGERGDRKAG
jgi:phosphatidylglycerophosphate synthase